MLTDIIPRGARRQNARRTSSAQRRYQHVLDVTVRSSQAGRQRQRRIVGWLTKFLIVASLGTALYYGGKEAISWIILKNPDYNVAALEVQTDGILQSEQVLQMADLRKGGNIFLVNLNRAKTRIESIPEVEHAQVSRRLPNAIVVQISERKPVAWLSVAPGSESREDVIASKGSFLVDTDGFLLAPRKRSAQERYLPIIRHYTGGALAEGTRTQGEEMKAALELLHAHEESLVAARFQILEIDLAKHYGLLVTDRNGTQVLFALEEMGRQLNRLDTYLQYTDQHGQKIQTINLLVQKNVPVTYMVDAVAIDKPINLTDATASTVAAAVVNPAPAVPPVKGTAAVSFKDKKPADKKSVAQEKKHDSRPSAEGSHADHQPQPFLKPAMRVTPAGVN